MNLTPWWKDIQLITAERNSARANARTKRVWTPNHNLIGIIGEYLYHLDQMVPLDRTIYPPGQGDGHYDFLLPDGRTVDVKATQTDPPRLLVVPNKRIYADFFVSVWVRRRNNRLARIVGWATCDEVLATTPRRLKYGPMHCIPCRNLHRWDLWPPPRR